MPPDPPLTVDQPLLPLADCCHWKASPSYPFKVRIDVLAGQIEATSATGVPPSEEITLTVTAPLDEISSTSHPNASVREMMEKVVELVTVTGILVPET